MDSPRIHAETRIGCVYPKVANVERSLGFRDVSGFEVAQRYGEEDGVLLAIFYPERPEPARALREPLDAEYPLYYASDHGGSEAPYLRDPNDNGVELYWDRPREAWHYDGEGNPALRTQPLDVRGCLTELDGAVRGR